MEIVISLALAILLAYVIYKCLGNLGFWKTFFIVLAIDIICTLLQGEGITFLSVIVKAISNLIYVAICSWAYKKASGFITYLLLAFLIRVLIVVIPALLLSGMFMAMMTF